MHGHKFSGTIWTVKSSTGQQICRRPFISRSGWDTAQPGRTSKTRHGGEETSEGEQERPIPVLSRQEILQLPDEAVIGFCRNLPPFKAQRMSWLRFPTLKERQKIDPPPLPPLPKLEETQAVSAKTQPEQFSYVSPNGLQSGFRSSS